MTSVDLAQAEALGARALALLQAARRAASRDAEGRTIPLQAQDRRLWDAGLIADAMRLVDRALGAREVGALTLRAAIEALHAQAHDAAATDWHRIAALYDLLAEIDASPEVADERSLAHARRAAARHHEESHA